MKVVYTVELSIEVPATGRTPATVQAVERWQAMASQLGPIANGVELKRMRLATDPKPKGLDDG